MTRLEKTFDAPPAIRLPFRRDRAAVRFDIFVGPGFNAHEAAAITETLGKANAVVAQTICTWRYVSDKPGMTASSQDLLVRAEPALPDHNLPDVMIVVGGKSGSSAGWMGRLRQMQRSALTVVLLSDAATAYINATKAPSGRVTTHWRDAVRLEETGYHPTLTKTLSECSDGIITAAGSGATAELLIGLMAPFLDTTQVAELGNRLLLPQIRKSDADQPRLIADNQGLFDHRITHAIRLMEETLAEPLRMSDLTRQVGVSTRHLERVFREVFSQSPARFYKQLRTKRARMMIEETLVPLSEVAVAAGFGTYNTMSQAVKAEYGMTPSKMRERKGLSLLAYGAP